MQADLTAARAKLGRAKKTFDELDRNVREFLASRPYELVPVQLSEGDPGSELDAQIRSLMAKHQNLKGFTVTGPGRPPAAALPGLQLHVNREPDTEWALDLGEIGVNTRSALDYLVNQLAINDAGSEGNRTQFPIFINESDYRHGKRPPREKMLKGVARKHRRIIDNLQPYQRGPRQRKRDPLAILQAVTNRDKHTDWFPAYAQVQSFGVQMHLGDGALEIEVDVEEPQIYGDGDAIRVPTMVSPDTKMEVVGEPLEIVFRGLDRLVTLDDMARVILHVSGILDDFERRIGL